MLTENREQEHGFGLLLGKKNIFVSKESSEIVEEVKKQLWLAGPLISVNVLQFSLQLISVMFVGHLGELSLSSASIATSFASVSGFSLVMGMGSALDTLCGQSYGAKQYHMLGIHMQRAMIVLLLVSVPLAFIWANTGLILSAVGQGQDISFEAGVYARYMIPSLFAFGLLQCEVRFLLTQSIVLPMMISSAVTALAHILVCWVLVFKTDLGYRGAAMANAISYWINTLLLALYIKFSDTCKRTWTGFSKEAVQDIYNFMSLAIPSAVMVCLEVWSFDMMVLLSGFLPNPKLETSVLSIRLSFSDITMYLHFSQYFSKF
ncbi:protein DETOXIFICATION 16-like [Papaver somniferum]|uniref:protein DETOXIFICATION 16-like n=1 Tax=Papaver somniferum TaxID=3469 RepID=UPI000E703274|nr:protein DETOXIFICATION 16-like [Papaver somniferum]